MTRVAVRAPIFGWALVAACSSAATPGREAATTASEGGMPAQEFGGQEGAAEGETVDLWGDSCTREVRGVLSVSRSQVLFRRLDSPGEPRRDVLGEAVPCDSGIEAQSEVGAARSWTCADVVLPVRFNENGVDISPLLPHPTSGRPFVLLTEEPDSGRGESGSLVVIDPRTLAVEEWWRSEGRLQLLGVVGRQAIVLVQNGDVVRAMAIEAETSRVVVSEPVPLEFLFDRPAEPQRFLPLGRDGFVFACGEGEVCILRVTADALALERVPLEATSVHWSEGGAVIGVGGEDRFSPAECVLTGGKEPSAWVHGQPCDPDAWFARLSLPVDGEHGRTLEVAVPECLVQDRLVLPPLPDRDPQDFADGIGVVALPDPRSSADRPAESRGIHLLVRGDTVAVGYAEYGFGAGATVGRDWAIPLTPQNVEARRVVVDDRYLYRLWLKDVFLPLDPGGGDCWQGRLVVRVTGDENQAFVNFPREYGACE
ncbi:MAG: hypothetical protein HY905_11875 [Deltaproteobacteria bacterium]|nr:hypothetical protein [Deltaproteobacteria bacterium]